MNLRSMLFVPGDSERKLLKGAGSGADALVLALEDSGPADRIGIARTMVRADRAGHRDRSKQELWVRVNPLSTEKALPDLAVIAGGPPDGILLPKTTSANDVVELDHYLSALEAREGVAQGSIRIMAVATETPIALFMLGTFAGCSPRLAGMTWGAEDLSSALGAATNRDEEGNLEFTYRLARSLCLAAAVAANVQPIDTAFVDFCDFEG